MRKTILAAALALAAASTANAQSSPVAGPANTLFTDNLSANGLMGDQHVMNVPQVNYTEEARLREVRARAAAGLIRAGRCDAALRLAAHQRDDAMVKRIGEVCAAEPAALAPSRPL